MLGNLCTKHSNTIHLVMRLAFHPSLEQNKMVLQDNSALSPYVSMHVHLCMHIMLVTEMYRNLSSCHSWVTLIKCAYSLHMH